jgi:hypothetical protein
MIDPSWVTAISSGIVAITGPVALSSWLAQRRETLRQHENERHEQERHLHQQEHEQLLEKARKEFIPREWGGLAFFFAVIGCLIAWDNLTSHKRGGSVESS